MDNSSTLQDFNTNVDAYAKVRGFIDKARSRGGKFSSDVIEKVCLTHEVKSMEIAENILPSVAKIEETIATLLAEVEGVESTKGGAAEVLEELELRHVIGELTDEEFKEQSASLTEELSAADGKINVAQESADEYKAALDRWIELATAAGQDTGTSAAAPEAVVEEPEVESAPVEVAPLESVVEEEVIEEEADLDDGLVPGSSEVPGSDEPEVALFGESSVDSEENLFGEEPEAGLVLEPKVTEAETPEESPAINNGDAEDDRRALLLYQEGTADETIYPFDGEEITIGRGRTNVIQIKNDSKVSRRHCRLFKADSGEYYIKDNDSSNGSLVNGELITERRLFGGEEVIIGETFFRFRIME